MVNVDNILAASVRSNKSRIIARESIGATQAPKAWNTRHATISVIEVDMAHPTEPITNNTGPNNNGILRPYLSLTAPHTSCAISSN